MSDSIIFRCFFVTIAQLKRFLINRQNLPEKIFLNTNNLEIEFAFSKYRYNSEILATDSFSTWADFLFKNCLPGASPIKVDTSTCTLFESAVIQQMSRVLCLWMNWMNLNLYSAKSIGEYSKALYIKLKK